jgi:hypothetical protein
MPSQTYEVGSIALVGAGQYALSLDAVVSFSTLLPSAAARGTTKKGGILTATCSIEGQNARYTDDGVAPTAANGILLTAPTVIVFRTEELIKTIKMIDVAAGGKLNITFRVDLIG